MRVAIQKALKKLRTLIKKRKLLKLQELILPLVNNPIARKYLGVPLNKKIVALSANSVHYQRNKQERTAIIYGSPAIKRQGQKVLRGGTQVAMMLLALGIDRKLVVPLVALTTTSFYPDAAPESTSVDGNVHWAKYSGAGNWSTGRDATDATSVNDSAIINYIAYIGYYSGYADPWYDFQRGIFLFDTSALPDNANISSATFSLYVDVKADGLGSQAVSLCSSAPAVNTALAVGDYDSLGTTRFAPDLTIAGMTLNQYNVWTLNDAGKNAISKIGITKFGTRMASDLDNAEPGSPTTDAYVRVKQADNGSNEPKLEVTYTIAPTEKVLTEAFPIVSSASKSVGKTMVQSLATVSAYTAEKGRGFTQSLAVVSAITTIATLSRTITETIKAIGSSVYQASRTLLESLNILSALGSYSTGWKDPTATGENYNNWNNPTYAYASDSNRADSASQVNYQDYYNFSLGVPSGATIEGILVSIQGYTDYDGGGSGDGYVRVSWDGGNSWTSEKLVAISRNIGNESYIDFGGVADLWGRAWSVSELSDANFRVAIRFPMTGNSWFVNHLRTEVVYSVSLTPKVLTEAFSVVPLSATSFLKIIIEVIKTVSSSVYQTSKTLTESLNILSVLANVLSAAKTLVESIIANPVFAKISTIYKTFTESVVVVGSILNQTARTIIENIQTSDTYSKIWSAIKTFTDTVIVVPTIATIATLLKTLSEIISVSGSKVYQAGKMFTDRIVALPILSSVLTALKSLIEVFKVGSHAFFATSELLVEVLVIMPLYSAILSAKTTFTETIKVIDAITKQTGRILVEAFNIISPKPLFNISKTFIEVVIIVPLYDAVLAATKTLVEQIKIATSFLTSGVFYKVLNETLTVLGNIIKQSGKIFVELIVSLPIHQTILTAAKMFVEVIKVVGGIAKQTGKTFIEALNILNPAITTIKVLLATYTEVVKMGDIAVSKVLSAVKVLTEQVKIALTFLTTGIFYKILNESVKAISSVVRKTGKVFVEIVVMLSTRQVILTAAKTFVETIIAMPTLAYLTTKNLLERIFACDAVQNITFMTKTLAESIVVIGLGVIRTVKVFLETVSVIIASLDFMRIRILTEVIKVFDNVVFNVSRTFSEVVKIISSFVSKIIKVLSENIVVQVILVPPAIGKVFFEIILGSVSWLFGKTQYVEFVDVIKSNVDIVFSTSKTLTERVKMASDVIIRYLGRVFDEIVYVAKKQGEYLYLLYGKVKSESFVVVGILGSWSIGKMLTEVVKVFDILTHAISRVLKEVLKASASVLAIGTKLLIESINVIGAMAERVITRVLMQVIKMGDVIGFRHTFYKSLVDVIKASGQVFNQTGRILTDSIIVVSSFVLGTISKMLVEIVKVFDNITNIWTMGRLYTEAVKILDSIFHKPGQVFVESIKIVGSFVLGTISKMLVEIVKISGIIAKSLPKLFTETIVVVSASFNQAGKILSEVVEMVGTFVLGTISKLFIEPVKVIVSFITAGVFYTTLTEVISVVSNAFNQAGKIFTEIVSVVPAFVLGTISKVLTEVVKMYDTFNFAITRVLKEAFNILDVSYNQAGKIFTEIIEVVGSMASFAIGKLLSETIEVGTALTRTISRVFAEIVKVIGTIYQIGSSFIIYETIQVVDPTTLKAIGRTFQETVIAGWAKIKLVLNGVQVGWWKKIARVRGLWRKISRNDN